VEVQPGAATCDAPGTAPVYPEVPNTVLDIKTNTDGSGAATYTTTQGFIFSNGNTIVQFAFAIPPKLTGTENCGFPATGTVTFSDSKCEANQSVGNSLTATPGDHTFPTYTVDGGESQVFTGTLNNLPAGKYVVTLTGTDGSQPLVFTHTFTAAKSALDCAIPLPVKIPSTLATCDAAGTVPVYPEIANAVLDIQMGTDGSETATYTANEGAIFSDGNTIVQFVNTVEPKKVCTVITDSVSQLHRLPTTGSDTSGWLAAAFLLLMLGAAAGATDIRRRIEANKK